MGVNFIIRYSVGIGIIVQIVCSDTCTDRKGEHVYERLGTVTHGKVIENMTIVSLGKPDMTGQDKEQNAALASKWEIINQKHTNLINADKLL